MPFEMVNQPWPPVRDELANGLLSFLTPWSTLAWSLFHKLNHFPAIVHLRQNQKFQILGQRYAPGRMHSGQRDLASVICQGDWYFSGLSHYYLKSRQPGGIL